MIDVLNSDNMIYYINSLPRIGCKPFDFIDPNILHNDRYYQLIEMELTSLILEQVSSYSGNPISRINKKAKTSDDIDKYLKIYNNKDFPPVVISSDGKVIDGFHRLSYFRENNIKKFLCYKGVK